MTLMITGMLLSRSLNGFKSLKICKNLARTSCYLTNANTRPWNTQHPFRAKTKEVDGPCIPSPPQQSDSP